MNKKILIGIVIAIVIASVGIVGVKAMLGDEATELPLEEQAEKSLNLQEKYESADRITSYNVCYTKLLRIKIDWYFPQRDAIEKLEGEKGLFSFRESLENRKECCAIRKVEPLQRALQGFSAWTTGMRRTQSVTRTELQPLEFDAMHGDIVKINPLAFWDEIV